MTAGRRASIAPRMLTKEQAADYCGLSVPTFARSCPIEPAAIGDDPRLVRYDLKLLDVWLDTFGPGVAASGDDLWLQRARGVLTHGVE